MAAAAGCLKMFLRELPEAVVPCRFTTEFVTALRGKYRSDSGVVGRAVSSYRKVSGSSL